MADSATHIDRRQLFNSDSGNLLLALFVVLFLELRLLAAIISSPPTPSAASVTFILSVPSIMRDVLVGVSTTTTVSSAPTSAVVIVPLLALILLLVKLAAASSVTFHQVVCRFGELVAGMSGVCGSAESGSIGRGRLNWRRQ